MGCKWFAFIRLPISVIGMLLFLALELPQKYHILYTQDFNKVRKQIQNLLQESWLQRATEFVGVA